MRCLGLLLAVVVVGCGDDRNWKETVPVTGEVLVDGSPADGVKIDFNPVAGIDQAQPTQSTAFTDPQGKFEASTYEVGDGVPPGEYQITFTWPKLNKISMTFDGDDLKGKYSDPKKSKFALTVESGTPVDMGRIELQVKK